MTEKELEERIEKCLQNEASKAVWRKNFESDEFMLADALNRELFGESLEKKPRCACLENFYFSLRFRNPVKKFKYMTAKRFKVKPGVVLQSYALAEPLTPHSSDEDCIKLLRSNPNAIRLFESFPENWKELIEVEETEVEETEVEETEVEETEVEETEVEETAKMPDFANMSEPEMRKYAGENGISLKGKTGRVQIANLLIANHNDI